MVDFTDNDETKEIDLASAYPSELSVKHLMQKHPDYHDELLRQYSDLYTGGHRFEKNKDHYLRTRQLETSGSAGGAGLRNARLACASYTPNAAGIIDWLAAAAFQAEPVIIPQGGSETDNHYYHELNRNVDGCGRDLPSLMRSRLLEYMIHNRAYIAVEFPETPETDLGGQRSVGGLDARLRPLNARNVINWNVDDEGKLRWVLTYFCESKKLAPWSSDCVECHTWTYITATGSYEYEYVDDSKGGYSKSVLDDRAVAKLVEVRKNDLGVLPIIPIHIHGGPWVMDRIAPIALSLFNREASLQFALDQSAYAMMVVSTNKDISSLVASEVAAIKLSPNNGESVTFAAPPTNHFDSLQRSCEHLLASMYLAVQAMALQAASNDSNGRQSGVAKFRDFGAIAILISTFAAAMRDSIESAISIIKRARGDSVEISVAGLNQFDVQSRDVVLNLAKSYLDIPGIPETARRSVLAQVSDLMMVDAPTEMRSKAKNEALSGTLISTASVNTAQTTITAA